MRFLRSSRSSDFEVGMDTLLSVIHIVGVISFSAAGAMVAIDKEADWFGVVFLSLITCFGGGLIRDVIGGGAIERDLPLVFTMHTELIVSVLTATLVFILAALLKRKYVENEERVVAINNVLDALGIGVFTAAGCAAYIPLGPLVALFMGMITSIGGSITRDVILRDIPSVLRKHIYALAVLAGAAAYYLIAVLIMPGQESTRVVATLACTVVIFTIRMLATTFKWNIPKAIDFSKIREASESEEDKDLITK